MANPFSKSRSFYKIGNITNTPMWRIMPTPTGLGVVTTTGRNSGKPRARPMRVVRDGSRVYAVSLLGRRSDWLRNVRKNANVTIKLGRKTYRATARELVDPEERARAAAIYGPIAGWFDYADYANFVWSIPTRARLLRVHDEWFEKGVSVAFELGAEA